MKAQQKLNKYLIIYFIFIFLLSCTNLPSRTELFSDNREAIPALWLINDITLEQRILDMELKEKIPDTLIMLGNKYQIQIVYDETQSTSKSYAICG